MDGTDYVWIVSHGGYAGPGGFYCFSSAHAAGTELARRGVGWDMSMHRIWHAPLMGAGAVLREGFQPHDPEVRP